MDTILTFPEIRVLGCLMEKEATTPEYYPLTLNSLVAACNQKSNRNPVVEMEETDVAEAIEELRAKKLALRVDVAGSRVPKYRHAAATQFSLERQEQALLCVLLLRGPQTVGELRTRTERMYRFESLDAVEETLRELSDESVGLVTPLPRRPGQKEIRYIHLLSGQPDEPAEDESEGAFDAEYSAASGMARGSTVKMEPAMKSVIEAREERESLLKRIDALEQAIDTLNTRCDTQEETIARLQQELDTFRKEFE